MKKYSTSIVKRQDGDWEVGVWVDCKGETWCWRSLETKRKDVASKRAPQAVGVLLREAATRIHGRIFDLRGLAAELDVAADKPEIDP